MLLWALGPVSAHLGTVCVVCHRVRYSFRAVVYSYQTPDPKDYSGGIPSMMGEVWILYGDQQHGQVTQGTPCFFDNYYWPIASMRQNVIFFFFFF